MTDTAKYVEHLMVPRYMAIGDKKHYPGSPFKIGDILKQDENYHNIYWLNGNSYVEPNPPHYPALFLRLHWGDCRNPEEMPVYVKQENQLTPGKVEVYKTGNTCTHQFNHQFYQGVKFKSGFPISRTNLLPATEAEYLAYQSTLAWKITAYWDIKRTERTQIISTTCAVITENNPQWDQIKDRLPIYSVQRLLDGVVFSIKDRIRRGNCETTIKEIEINNFGRGDMVLFKGGDGQWLWSDDNMYNEEHALVKITVITTMDGRQRYEGDEVWVIDACENGLYKKVVSAEVDPMENVKYFSREEYAQFYFNNLNK